MGLVLGNGLGRSPAVRRSLISGENRIQINTENGAYNVRKGFSVGETGPTRAWTTRKITLFAPKSTKNAQFLLKNCAFYYILFNFLLKRCRFYCDLVPLLLLHSWRKSHLDIYLAQHSGLIVQYFP